MKPEGCTCHYLNKFERRSNSKCPVHNPRKYTLEEIKIAYTKGWQDKTFTGERTAFNTGAFDVKLNDFLKSLKNDE